MPTVSHYQLAQIAGTEHLWDADFRTLVEQIVAAPNDRILLGVFADWCRDHDEPELADAAGYMHRHPTFKLMAGTGKSSRWWLSNTPTPLTEVVTVPGRVNYMNPAGVLADVYYRLNEARKSLE